MRVWQLMSTVAVATSLAACGGGGGGGGGGAAVSLDANSGTFTPSGQLLSLTQVSLSATDVVASTDISADRTASFSRALLHFSEWPLRMLERVIPSASAVVIQPTYPPVSYAPGFLASRKLIDGNLIKLDPIVKAYQTDANGQPVLDNQGNPIEISITCDLSTAEISVNKLYELYLDKADFLANVTVPATVQSDCSINTRQAWIYVTETGQTYDVTTGLVNNIQDVIVAGDPAFNQSNTPLVVDSTGIVSYLELQANRTLKLTQLTTADAPVITNVTGSFSYDGQYLLGASSGESSSTPLFFVYQKDSTAFRLFRPGGSTNYYLNTGLDHQGRFLFHYASDYLNALNPEDLSFSEAFAGLTDTPPGATPVANQKWPGNMYGFQGRYGKWIMSDRGVLWNYETNDSLCLMTYPDTSTSNYDNCAWGGTYVRLWGKYAYAVDRDKNIFVRYDLDSGTGVSFNIGNSGFLARDFKIFKDLAMVEVVQSSTSDKKYVELNFDKNLLIERGVITSGGRTVSTFTALGG